MAEHRSSISSNGPAFLSMSLQQLNELEECPPLSSITTYTKEEHLHSSTNGSSHMLKASSSVNGIGTKHSGNPAMNASSGSKLPVTVTTTTPSLSSSLYLDNSADDIVIGTTGNNSDHGTVTIDMIQTLPTFDAAAYANNNGDVYNNSLRCYISNMIMPSTNCKSTCTIRDATSLSHVLNKINDFLRVQCIAYTMQSTPTTVAFHCERNSAFASLVGPSLVFVIYLWFEENAPKSENDVGSGTSDCKPILIDVQRRRGCPLDLQCLRRSLFRSLLNTESATELVVSRQGMIPLDICRSIWSKYNVNSSSDAAAKDNDDATMSTETASQFELDSSNEHANSEAMEILIHYQSMLDVSNTVDSHRMGLECLCQHTDSSVTDVAKSKAVVQAIVRGPSKHGQDDPYDIVVEKFRSSLLHFFTKGDTPEVTPVLDSAGCAPKNLQCLAFRTVYTSLNTYISTTTSTTESDAPDAVLSIENDQFWYTVIQTCRRGIVTSNTAPCFATMSIVVIYALLSSTIVSNLSKEMIYDVICPKNDCTILRDELTSAHAWGQQHHTYLEAKSQQLLDLLACQKNVPL